MRLKTKLTLVFLLLALLPLLLAGGILIRNAYQTAYRQQLSVQRQEARTVATQVESLVNSMVRQLSLAMRMYENKDSSLPELRRFIAELAAWQNQFQDLAWINAKGDELVRENLHEVITPGDLKSRAGMAEFQIPLISGAVWYGPVELEKGTAEPLMVISIPSLNPTTGQSTAVLVSRIRLKSMWDIVSNVGHPPDGGVIYITNLDGQIVAHPNPSVVLRSERADIPDTDGIYHGMDGRTVLLSRVAFRLGDRDFLVISERPLSQAMNLPINTTLTTGLILGLALLLALFLVILATRTIITPLQRLAQVAGEISAGDLTRRADFVHGKDEISELAQAFNKMTERLHGAVSTLETRVLERTQDLSHAQSRLVEAIESISEGFVLCDAEDRIVLTNRKFRDFYTEISHLARPGRPFRDIIIGAATRGLARNHDCTPEEWTRRRLELRARQTPHVQLLNSGRWLLVNERRTASGLMVAIYTDITELKENEEALRTAKIQAESGAKAKSEFLASMSHELRTPLNAIIGFSDTIISEIFGPIDNARYLDYVRDINSSGQHLLSLINDILDLSKIEAGRMDIEHRTVDLGLVMDNAVSMMRDSAHGAKLLLDTRHPSDPVFILGDERRLLQILLNLLSNAVKFTPEGGRITVMLRIEGNEAVLDVSDTGIGIAPEHIARALEVFGQVESARSRRYPGSGLGLPLSRQLIELHGGRLNITSAVGHGTTVTIYLPLTQ